MPRPSTVNFTSLLVSYIVTVSTFYRCFTEMYITNDGVRLRTCQPPSTLLVTTRRLRLFGHIARAGRSQPSTVSQLTAEVDQDDWAQPPASQRRPQLGVEVNAAPACKDAQLMMMMMMIMMFYFIVCTSWPAVLCLACLAPELPCFCAKLLLLRMFYRAN